MGPNVCDLASDLGRGPVTLVPDGDFPAHARELEVTFETCTQSTGG